MSDDPLDDPAAKVWRLARQEAPAPQGFAVRVLAARRLEGTGPLREPTRPRPRLRWLEVAALAAGGAWFVARVAGLFLVFSAS